MADDSFDAVIVGGGTKGLFLAMYLTRYAGMSVGIFERRHEIGGCLSTEEISAPGFRGNDHANVMLPLYWLPLYRDFPEFWDYGARYDQHLCSDGFVFRDNETCLAIYSDKHDIGREHIPAALARRVELIQRSFGCLMWYSFAVHEAPRYKAEAFNPDIHECNWLGLQPDPDPVHIARECFPRDPHYGETGSRNGTD